MVHEYLLIQEQIFFKLYYGCLRYISVYTRYRNLNINNLRILCAKYFKINIRIGGNVFLEKCIRQIVFEPLRIY